MAVYSCCEPLRAVLFSLALRSCSCCSSGWAFCPPCSSPHPCPAPLSAGLEVWGATALPLGPAVTPRLLPVPLHAAHPKGWGEGLWRQQGTDMEELAREQTSTATGLVSFSRFSTELLLSFPFRLTDRRVSLSLSKVPLFQIVAGNELGVVWHLSFPGMRAVSLGMLSLLRGALLSAGPLRTAWVGKNRTSTKQGESLKTQNLTLLNTWLDETGFYICLSVTRCVHVSHIGLVSL